MGKAGRQPGLPPQALGRWWPVRRWLGGGLDLVFPPQCACCHDSLESGSCGRLCAACRATLVDRGPSCPRCGWSVPQGGEPAQCPRCRDERFHFRRVVRLGAYDGPLRAAVLRIKRPDERVLAVALGDLLAESAGSTLAALEPDVVVPVPMHWTRRLWRGANSADEIARRVAGLLQLPMRGGLLVRRRRTVPQASLSPKRRLANVRGAFRPANHADLSGSRIVLVDDIMTTGATVNEAAKTLSRSGATVVAVAVLARAPGLA